MKMSGSKRGASKALRLIAFALAFLASFGIAAAWGGVAQDGRVSNSHVVDGASAYLEGNSFYAPANACVLYGLVVFDEDAYKQIETGLVRCNSVPGGIQGTCPGGRSFVERISASTTSCVPGPDFNNDTLYYAYILRNSASSTTVTGNLEGAQLSLSGFGLNNTVYTMGWGEVTGSTSSCPTGDAQGEISLWDKWIDGSGWSTVSSTDILHAASGISTAPCWTVGVQGSGGGFHVW